MCWKCIALLQRLIELVRLQYFVIYDVVSLSDSVLTVSVVGNAKCESVGRSDARHGYIQLAM